MMNPHHLKPPPPPGSDHLRVREGFTFVELSVVLVIIAVAAALILPYAGSNAVSHKRFRSSMQQLAAAGVSAQNLAITNGKLHLLCVELESGRFYITPGDSDSAIEGSVRSLPEGSRLIRGELEGEPVSDLLRVRFAPDGWADNASITAIGPAGASAIGETVTISFTLNSGKMKYESTADR